MASIHSEDQNSEVLRACTEVAGDGDGDTGVWNRWEGGIGHYCWIGFNDAAREGTFVWSDGSDSDYTNWNPPADNNQGCPPEPNSCGDPNVDGGGAPR